MDVGHSCVAIIDNKRKTVEIADPNGEGWSAPLFILIRDYLKDKTEYKSYNFIEPWQSCVATGLQAKTRTEDCAHWSLL
jgi:hypothetical protein